MTKTFMQINDNWALGADSLQWMLQRRRKGGCYPVSFVSSTKAILARCMREKGVPADDAQRALDRLPDTFKQWAESQYGLDTGDLEQTPLEDDPGAPPPPITPPRPASEPPPAADSEEARL